MSALSSRIRRSVLTSVCVVVFGSIASAQDPRKMIKLDEVKWPPAATGAAGTSGVGAIQTVVLKGDPSKAGLYTLMLRVADPNVRIQAHSHSDDRVATVIKGTWYFAYGDTFDEAKLTTLPPGSVYAEPPNVNHYAMTKGEVIIQITGTGPSKTTYVEATADPTRR